MGVARVALGQLGGDELRPAAVRHVLVEAPLQLARQRLIPGQSPRLQQRGADDEVLAREAQALVHRARGVAHLEPQVPQGVEQGLDHRLGMVVGLGRAQEQQVHVGMRRHCPASVPAYRHQGEGPSPTWGGGLHVFGHEVEQRHDDDVGQPGQQTCGLDAAQATLQPDADAGAPLIQRLAQTPHRLARPGAHVWLGTGDAVQVVAQGRRVDDGFKRFATAAHRFRRRPWPGVVACPGRSRAPRRGLRPRAGPDARRGAAGTAGPPARDASPAAAPAPPG